MVFLDDRERRSQGAFVDWTVMKSHSRTRLGRTGIESGGCPAKERSRADFPCSLDTKCAAADFVIVVATISHVAKMEVPELLDAPGRW